MKDSVIHFSRAISCAEQRKIIADKAAEGFTHVAIRGAHGIYFREAIYKGAIPSMYYFIIESMTFEARDE